MSHVREVVRVTVSKPVDGTPRRKRRGPGKKKTSSDLTVIQVLPFSAEPAIRVESGDGSVRYLDMASGHLTVAVVGEVK